MADVPTPGTPATRSAWHAAWRTLVVAAGAYWLGGAMFYITVVIHTAHRVLDSQREVGFITRQVTQRTNAIGVAVLALLFLNLLVECRRASVRERSRFRGHLPGAVWVLMGTWLAMACLHAGLYVLHPRIDRLLDPAAQLILDRRAFRRLHNAYMLVTTLQLAAGVAHLWAALVVWSRSDRAGAADATATVAAT
jgi:hypothetical protein